MHITGCHNRLAEFVTKFYYSAIQIAQILLILDIAILFLNHEPVIANWLYLKIVIEINYSRYLCF